MIPMAGVKVLQIYAETYLNFYFLKWGNGKMGKNKFNCLLILTFKLILMPKCPQIKLKVNTFLINVVFRISIKLRFLIHVMIYLVRGKFSPLISFLK